MLADYLRPEQLAVRFGLSEEEVQRFDNEGVIRAITKNGYRYYSVRECHRLRAILNLMRDQGLSLADARAQVEARVKRTAAARTSGG